MKAPSAATAGVSEAWEWAAAESARAAVPKTPASKRPTEKASDKDSPLKQMLDAKVLPEKKIEEPVTGFLFFPMENQKMKDLELVYGGKENRIRIRFK